MARDRIEDFGALSFLIEKALDHPFFQMDRVYSRDYQSWFDDQPKEDQKDILDEMIRAVDDLEVSLEKALLIARGEDGSSG